jgi:hypothetical protein
LTTEAYPKVDLNKDEFVANPYTYFHKWRKWTTVSANATATVTTTATCGDDSAPPATATMTLPTGSEALIAHWQVAAETAIVKWNVTGGLTYVDS